MSSDESSYLVAVGGEERRREQGADGASRGQMRRARGRYERPLCGGGDAATAVGAAKRGVPRAELDGDSDAADVPRGERALGVAELREADVVHVVGRLHALDQPLLGRVEVERQHLRRAQE
tara:strand:+ start:315 stop:677 length:363 start_codon:yes stop_codon:yes gene_type:complete